MAISRPETRSERGKRPTPPGHGQAGPLTSYMRWGRNISAKKSRYLEMATRTFPAVWPEDPDLQLFPLLGRRNATTPTAPSRTAFRESVSVGILSAGLGHGGCGRGCPAAPSPRRKNHTAWRAAYSRMRSRTRRGHKYRAAPSGRRHLLTFGNRHRPSAAVAYRPD